jgi:hypothetical protein
MPRIALDLNKAKDLQRSKDSGVSDRTRGAAFTSGLPPMSKMSNNHE